jgi:hypothetical protein
MTAKLAILGTCASEDWIRYQNQREAIDVRITPARLHTSLISMTAEPVECPDDLGDIPDWKKDLVRRDFSKTFLVDLAGAKPDFLLVDLLSDARDGVINYRGSWITRSFFFAESKASKLAHGSELLYAHRAPRRYLHLFRNSVLELSRHLDTHLRGCRVILHKARFAESFLDDDGTVQGYSERKLQMHRTVNWNAEMLEGVFEREIGCEAIAVNDPPVLADSGHIWGLGGLHYERAYYLRFASALRAIVG